MKRIEFDTILLSIVYPEHAWQDILQNLDVLNWVSIAQDQFEENNKVRTEYARRQRDILVDDDLAPLPPRFKIYWEQEEGGAMKITGPWFEMIDPADDRRKIQIANPNDGAMAGGSRGWEFTIFALGPYYSRWVGVWADSIESAIEEVAGYLRDRGWNGYFVSDETMKEYEADAARDLGLEHLLDVTHHQKNTEYNEEWSRIWDRATQGLTYTESGYMNATDWAIFAEAGVYQDDAFLLYNLLNPEVVETEE